MKALTLIQPWASLVAIGEKRVETRSWSARYRGPLAIHAAKGFPRDAQSLCYEWPFEEALRPMMTDAGLVLPRGAVIAICRLYDVVPVEDCGSDLSELSEWEHEFGNYEPGRFAWILDEVTPLATPIPAKGALGLWEWAEPWATPAPRLAL